MADVARVRFSRPTWRVVIVCLWVFNMGVVFLAAADSDRSALGAVIAASEFWALVAAFPSVRNRHVLFSPRNYLLLLFFLSMVVGPLLMLSSELLPRLWILTDANWDVGLVWSYMPMSALVWGGAMLAYALGVSVNPRVSSHRPLREPPGAWMLLTGVALIIAGVVGLSIAAGSPLSAVAIAGRRAAAHDVAGNYRFSGWMEAVPVGAALVWYYATQRRPGARLQALGWVVALYLPLVPFYLYSAGRARTLIPLALLLALYHRYVHRFRARWLALALVLLTPALGAWAAYRAGFQDVHLDGSRIDTVLAADFSRFEVTTVALAGFSEAGLPYYMGRTFYAAIRYWLPSFRSADPEGTLATAQALAGDGSWSGASSYASSLVLESYINFGIAGVVVILFLLGRFVTALDRLASSGKVLVAVCALNAATKLPFAVSAAVSVSQLVWAVGLPLLVARSMQLVLHRRYPRRNVRSQFASVSPAG